ncbi:hypothetical protein HYALB_00008415 [Hymenoscyphus albidus]|uniref:UbiA prenyltransferase n=1 Tax=Hymenoscyphus albidus TaxID=595503 RepID=A0A9N9LN91_9HELO|nr:hypothetical protein HYALB_00008415 [Hymenoscyphus albidus]
MITALGFGVFSWSSLKTAIGGEGGSSLAEVTSGGFIWITITSGVIFTTMHVQDLKDVLDDKARGRKMAPLLLGEKAAQWTLVILILLWSSACAWFWGAWIMGSITAIFGNYIAWRCLHLHGNVEDRKTWQMWCEWTALISLMSLGR